MPAVLPRRSTRPAFLLAVAALAASVACREQTAPRDARPEPDVRGASLQIVLPTPKIRPNISSLTLHAKKLAIGGPDATYVAEVHNPTGVDEPGITVQGEIVQGHAARGAGGFGVQCPGPDDTLPPGTCSMTLTVVASNAAGGTGTLVAGPAHFVLTLLRFDGVITTVLDRKAVGVLLVGGAPSLPWP
jgi:hypothetical protein